ncbi:acyl-CoA dehydrogenase [Cylindrospermum stagnale PCC 7417]|uniref:Dibenzothiophene monooxygenase n=1 Tax=Cylindrospermum stagnale PCC 7417 TaxID=56107 RepID=K9WZ72_9NOST|nr:acyl-CoA dehydrogenase family protein [Cylindrospermum stagnale]AFZ24822.1 acyl-CoA dehydrogenase [Cylindrospermum stagnale PCC 7417]
MPTAIKESQDYVALATSLALDFAQNAVERDKQGVTAKFERDRLRRSGLLKLIIPQEYGGLGATWITALEIVREFAKVDGSIAHLLGYHYLQVVTPHLFGTLEQKVNYYTWTARNNWFWGNALNPRDSRLTLTPNGNNLRLNGIKSFCSGAKDSDMLTVSTLLAGASKPVVLAIPTFSHGITIHNDWDNIGQRQTDSSSVSFSNVLVKEIEILADPESLGSPFAGLRVYISHLVRANILLGIALGAFSQAKEYTTSQTELWQTSDIESKSTDPYILQTYGQMWIDLQAVTSLTDEAAVKLQAAWEQGLQLTEAEFNESAIAITTATALATRVGLEITNQIFEVMGAMAQRPLEAIATDPEYGFDRYSRHLRSLTLDEPLAYKVRQVGQWVLNQELSRTKA